MLDNPTHPLPHTSCKAELKRCTLMLGVFDNSQLVGAAALRLDGRRTCSRKAARLESMEHVTSKKPLLLAFTTDAVVCWYDLSHAKQARSLP